MRGVRLAGTHACVQADRQACVHTGRHTYVCTGRQACVCVLADDRCRYTFMHHSCTIHAPFMHHSCTIHAPFMHHCTCTHFHLKTSEWLGIIVANTLPLETTLANQIGTDVLYMSRQTLDWGQNICLDIYVHLSQFDRLE